MKSRAITFILFFLSSLLCCSQIQISVTKGNKEVFRPGDKIELLIQLKTLPVTCADGMKRAKVYVSSMEIDSQTDWAQTGTAIWTKKIYLSFIETKKDEAKITVMRRVDKESLFKQLVFKIQKTP